MFVAVRPPPAVLDELAAALDAVRAAAPEEMRWSAPAQWHLTLCFLADVPDDKAARLTQRLRRAATRSAPLELRLAGGGRFGDRVLWAGAAGDLPGLRALATGVHRAALGADLQVERRRFKPHLTLARTSRPAPLTEATAALAHFAGAPWRATSIELVHSTLGAVPRGIVSDCDERGTSEGHKRTNNTAVHRTVAELTLGEAGR
jgi:2'-5' RNA ligase